MRDHTLQRKSNKTWKIWLGSTWPSSIHPRSRAIRFSFILARENRYHRRKIQGKRWSWACTSKMFAQMAQQIFPKWFPTFKGMAGKMCWSKGKICWINVNTYVEFKNNITFACSWVVFSLKWKQTLLIESPLFLLTCFCLVLNDGVHFENEYQSVSFFTNHWDILLFMFTVLMSLNMSTAISYDLTRFIILRGLWNESLCHTKHAYLHNKGMFSAGAHLAFLQSCNTVAFLQEDKHIFVG